MSQAGQNQNKHKNKSEAATGYPEDVEALINTLYTNLDKYRTNDNLASFKPAVWSVVEYHPALAPPSTLTTPFTRMTAHGMLRDSHT
jgi:hypothetical protein